MCQHRLQITVKYMHTTIDFGHIDVVDVVE